LRSWLAAVALPQQADQHRPERPVLFAVDQELADAWASFPALPSLRTVGASDHLRPEASTTKTEALPRCDQDRLRDPAQGLADRQSGLGTPSGPGGSVATWANCARASGLAQGAVVRPHDDLPGVGAVDPDAPDRVEVRPWLPRNVSMLAEQDAVAIG